MCQGLQLSIARVHSTIEFHISTLSPVCTIQLSAFLNDSSQLFGNFSSSLFFGHNFFTNQCFRPAICPLLEMGSEGWCTTQNSWIISWNITETKSSCQFDVQMITYQGQWLGWWGLPARGQPPLRSCRHRSAGTSPPGRWGGYVLDLYLAHFAHVHVLAVVNKDLLTVREAAMKRTTTQVPTPTKVREGGGEIELGELMPLWCLVLLGGKM